MIRGFPNGETHMTLVIYSVEKGLSSDGQVSTVKTT